MIQSRSRARLPPKSFQRLRIRRKFIRQKLQRHEPPQVRVLSLIHHAHSAAAQPFHNAVMRKGPANQRISRLHVPHILGRAPKQVNEPGRSGWKELKNVYSRLFGFDVVAASFSWAPLRLVLYL
jgi:hypothetical protein